MIGMFWWVNCGVSSKDKTTRIWTGTVLFSSSYNDERRKKKKSGSLRMPCSMTEITQKHTSLVLIFEVVFLLLSIYIVVLYDNVTFLGVFCLPSRLLSRLLTTMSIQLLIIICLYTNVIVLEALINTNYRLSHEAYVNVFKTGRFCLRDNNAMVIYMWTKCEQYPSSCIIYIYQF